jgi:hypothetical protein
MILVQYDGLTKLSEVTIESILLWIRIYDIPVSMMTKAFVTVLGEKVGRVMEVGDAIRDFKRVRIDFDLSKALMPHVSIKVRGKGVLEFVVKYESVPHFFSFVDISGMLIGSVLMRSCMRRAQGLALSSIPLLSKEVLAGSYHFMRLPHQPKGA